MYTDMPYPSGCCRSTLGNYVIYAWKISNYYLSIYKNHKLEHLSNFQQPSEYPKLVNEIICQSIFYNVKRYTIEKTDATSVCVFLWPWSVW